MDKLHFSSGDNQHYTPYLLLAQVCEFYGGTIDLDPCSNSLVSPHIPALVHYTEEMNGLNLPWFGKVFVNPPYSRRELRPFVEKAINEAKAKKEIEIVLLVPARTDTQWHTLLDPYSRCYIKGRLKFHNPKNNGNSAPFPSALFYLGDRDREFESYFSRIGKVFAPNKKTNRKEYMREYMRKYRSKNTT